MLVAMVESLRSESPVRPSANEYSTRLARAGFRAALGFRALHFVSVTSGESLNMLYERLSRIQLRRLPFMVEWRNEQV